jgi:energy-converting hydrogenase B subunit D
MINTEITIDGFLVIGMVSLAVACLTSKDLFKAIVLFVSLGLMVTLSWARLDAWDVAIAEAAIGTGLTGAILLVAWRKLDPGPDGTAADGSGPDNTGPENTGVKKAENDHVSDT